MNTYVFSNTNASVPNDRFGIMVCFTGEEGIVQEMAEWFHNHDVDGQIDSSFVKLLRESDIKLDIFCVEYYYYFLCSYLALILKIKDDLSSVLDFVDAYIMAKKGDVLAIPLDSISPRSLIMLHDDLVETVFMEKKPVYFPIINKLKSFNEIPDDVVERICNTDYRKMFCGYLYEQLYRNSENNSNKRVLMPIDVLDFFQACFERENRENKLEPSVLNGDLIRMMLESMCNSIDNSLRTIYNRDDNASVVIPEDIKEIIAENLFNHVWMASFWPVSYFF